MARLREFWSPIFTAAAGTVIAVGVVYVGASIGGMREDQASMKTDMAWVKDALSEGYPTTQAEQEHRRLYRLHEDQGQQIGALDGRVRDLESGRR